MEATITAVKPFLMDILKSRHIVKLQKKSALWSESLSGRNTFWLSEMQAPPYS